MRPAAKNTVCRFQSTLSVRRATAADLLALLRAIISIHALRKESDVADGDWPSGGLISIHALRKESDPHGSRSSAPASTFQSTLSVRRATRSSAAGVAHVHISIHALRKESDLATPGHHTPVPLFQSTLSVRRATRCYSSLRSLQTTFQSTLSVRRATM